MGSAADRLTGLVHSDDRFDYAFKDLEAAQVDAMNERFQKRKDQIKLLGHRAKEAGLTEVRSHYDMAQLLFPHTAYKSYPENWLMEERWDRMAKWLDTVSSYRVPVDAVKNATGIDDWIEKLEANGFNVSCSSGTTGKSAMLVASDKDMDWVAVETVACYAWGSGIKPARDRRMFGLAAVATVARNTASGAGQRAAYQDPRYEPFAYPVPPMTVGDITGMVLLRKKMTDGTALPSDIAKYEETSAARQKAVDGAVKITAQALIEARHDKIHVAGLWSGLYNVAKAVRDLGYSAEDFNPENSIYVGGGLKRSVLPDDYQHFVYETFNIQPNRNFQNYSMQELHTGMPKCQKGGRYHLPPWVVPLILDQPGETLLPMDTGAEYEGRAAFFDLSIDGRWGGVISGDKISIDFGPCACGNRGPSIRDTVTRYADLEAGDDKIGCAGTVDAYVRGVA
jgi:hypothetical protein